MLHDMAKNDYRTSNYLSFGAPLQGKRVPPSPETVAALRTYIFLHALRFWRRLPTWHWGGYDLERILPPAFPMHRAPGAPS